MQKRQQTGRTLVETLAVLLIIGLLSIMGLASYNYVIKKWRRQETVKQVSELATMYQAHRSEEDNDKVDIKKIYPAARRASTYEMKTVDSPDGRVSVWATTGKSSFAVAVDNIQYDTCIEMLKSGRYDAVLKIKNKGAYTKASESAEGIKAYGWQTVHEDEKYAEFCKAGKGSIAHLGLVFGNNCPNLGTAWWYGGECHACKQGQEQDLRGMCCAAGRKNACGYCEVDEEENALYYCLTGGADSCASLMHCDAGTGGCWECKTDAHCNVDGDSKNCKLAEDWTKVCSEGHCCPKGLVWLGANCSCPGDKEQCGGDCCDAGTNCVHHGSANTQTCCINNGNEGTTCASSNCCRGNLDCITGHCCPTGSKWTAGDSKCCRADRIYKNGGQDKCCSRDLVDGQCFDGCTGCWFGAKCYAVNQDVGTCGICKADHKVYKKDDAVYDQCCGMGHPDWNLKVSTTPIYTSNNCGICGTDGKGTFIGSSSGIWEQCCYLSGTNKWKLKAPTTPIYTSNNCGVCGTNGTGTFIGASSGIYEQCCNTSGTNIWRLKASTTAINSGADNCGVCGTDGKGTLSSGVDDFCCKKKALTPHWMLKWSGKTKTCSTTCCTSTQTCVNGTTCCNNDGSNGTTCSSASCCTSGNCSSGHCCASGYYWNGSSCVCVAAANGATCTASACCTSGNCSNGHCCASGYHWDTSACCASGYYWNGTSCVCSIAPADGTACASAECCASGNCSSGHCCASGYYWNGYYCTNACMYNRSGWYSGQPRCTDENYPFCDNGTCKCVCDSVHYISGWGVPSCTCNPSGSDGGLGVIKGKRFRITLPADTFVGSSDYPAFIDENGVAHRLPGYKDGSSPFYHGRCYNDVARTVTMGTANNGDMMLIIRTEVAQGAPASERAGAIAAVEPCSNWMSWPDQLNPYW